MKLEDFSNWIPTKAGKDYSVEEIKATPIWQGTLQSPMGLMVQAGKVSEEQLLVIVRKTIDLMRDGVEKTILKAEIAAFIDAAGKKGIKVEKGITLYLDGTFKLKNAAGAGKGRKALSFPHENYVKLIGKSFTVKVGDKVKNPNVQKGAYTLHINKGFEGHAVPFSLVLDLPNGKHLNFPPRNSEKVGEDEVTSLTALIKKTFGYGSAPHLVFRLDRKVAEMEAAAGEKKGGEKKAKSTAPKAEPEEVEADEEAADEDADDADEDADDEGDEDADDLDNLLKE